MSLTYYLKFKKKLNEKAELKKMISNQANGVFIISELYLPKYSYVDSYFDNFEINLELGEASEIMFSVVKKDVDPIVFRKLLLKTLHKITDEIYPEEDYFFDFNGDFVHELRENGIVKRNNKSDFYQGLD